MRTKSSRKLILSLIFFTTLIVVCFPVPAQADSSIVPWLSGGFASPGFLFSVTGTWQDYQWQFDLFPNLPDMTVTWSCDASYCEGWGGGAYSGGTAYGQISSISLNAQLYSFTGEIFTGSATREAGHCIPLDECPNYTYDQYYVNFKGIWSNGWYTVGNDYATDFESDWNGTHQSDILGWFTVTTYTPEPATLTLLGAGIIGVVVRRKRI